MQTFLPYPDLVRSARCLDYRRLGKQRVEAYQIVNVLTRGGTGWRNHPAVKMWRGHGGFLKLYANAMICEWVSRGFKNSMELYPQVAVGVGDYAPPSWYGDEKFHASHRSNLLRKDPEWYGRFGWVEPSDLPYVWPV